jgi:fructuronate reductase
VTTPGRLVAGLLARRDAGVGPLAVVPCDNVPDNGTMVRRVVTQLAAAVDPALAPWVDEHVSFVTTMVDRITPRATDADVAEVRRLLGVEDPETVVTEPFAEWVLAGEFPGGRPAWEEVGARFVADVHPFETRKLWLLNGAHSILAYAGSVLGHDTVADAMADRRVAGWVDEWWDCAARYLPLPREEVTRYRHALVDRFANPQIRHLLAQIAADGSQKVPIRGLPVFHAARKSGELPPGPTRFLAGWIVHLRGFGVPVVDVAADEVVPLAAGPVDEAVERVLAWLGVADVEVTALVSQQVTELEAHAVPRS